MASCSVEEFIEKWMTLETVTEVAEALGVTYSSVAQRASRLRKEGVKLPSKQLRARRTDVATLNALVEKYRAPASVTSMDGEEMMPFDLEDSDA